jgi:hypothetical protein
LVRHWTDEPGVPAESGRRGESQVLCRARASRWRRRLSYKTFPTGVGRRPRPGVSIRELQPTADRQTRAYVRSGVSRKLIGIANFADRTAWARPGRRRSESRSMVSASRERPVVEPWCPVPAACHSHAMNLASHACALQSALRVASTLRLQLVNRSLELSSSFSSWPSSPGRALDREEGTVFCLK